MEMKAAVLYEPNKPMVVETIDIDEPREGEAVSYTHLTLPTKA